MVTFDQIERGVAAYLDNELMPMIPEQGFQKIIAGTAISLMIKKTSGKFEMFRENQFVKMMGVIDESGNVDVETLKDELKKQVPDAGVKVEVPMIGMLTFHKTDVDKLYSYIVNV